MATSLSKSALQQQRDKLRLYERFLFLGIARGQQQPGGLPPTLGGPAPQVAGPIDLHRPGSSAIMLDLFGIDDLAGMEHQRAFDLPQQLLILE